MVTPTFLAGFCIVLASILAYGTTQTHLLYSSGLPPACAGASCRTVSPHPGSGGPLGTSASPEKNPGQGAGASQPRQAPGRQAPGQPATGGGGTVRPSRAPGAPSGHPARPPDATGPRGGPPGPRVAVVYRTVVVYQAQKRRSGKFLAAVTITNKGTTVFSGWQLRMSYRRVTVTHMWGARWFPAGPDQKAGLAAAPSDQRPLRPGMSVRFVYLARGAAGPPGGCAFNGYRCTFQPRSPRNPRRPHTPAPGRHHAHNPGPSRAHNPGPHSSGTPGSSSPGSTGPQSSGSQGPQSSGSQGASSPGTHHHKGQR